MACASGIFRSVFESHLDEFQQYLQYLKEEKSKINEIERVFLSMGEVLATQRMSLTVEHLKHHLIIYCYNTVCN